jgi:hypothetical protein
VDSFSHAVTASIKLNLGMMATPTTTRTGKRNMRTPPQHDLLEQCIGNNSPHICLACSEEFMVDPFFLISARLKCKEGKFAEGLRAIS